MGPSNPGPYTGSTSENPFQYYPMHSHQVASNQYENYNQNKLMRAGDVERCPGPKKKDQPRIHIVTSLIILVLLLNKIKTSLDNIKTAKESWSKVLKSTKTELVQPFSYIINPSWNQNVNQRTIGGTMKETTYDQQYNNKNILLNFEILKLKSNQDSQANVYNIYNMTVSGSTMNAYVVQLQTIAMQKQETEKLRNHFNNSITSECRPKDLQENIFIIVKIRQKLISSIDMKGKKYQILLLLLGGDIKMNPGPTPHQTCINCRNEIDVKEALRCESCAKWCHKDCDPSSKNKPTILEECTTCTWICPDPLCKPNTMLNPGQKLLKCEDQNPLVNTSPSIPNKPTSKHSPENRFQVLRFNTDAKVIPKTKQKKIPTSKQRPKDENLLSHLTKITPKDYQGKEICNECHKSINDERKNMCCVKCQRWTHRKCSQSKTIADNKTRNLWICNQCLEVEDLPVNIEFSNEDFRNISGTNLTTMKQLKEMKSKYKRGKLWILFNCRSLNHAYNEIEEICIDVAPDFLVGVESWLDESNPKNAYIPEGYAIKRKDRSDEYKHKYGKKSGGGVVVMHKENISVTIMPSLNTAEEEILWIKVKDKNKTCLYGSNYRASYCDQLNGETSPLEKNIVKASTLSRNIVMMGDLNCDLNNPNPDPSTRKLITCMAEMNLKQIVSGATRIETGEPKLLDHIWVEEQMCEDILETGICTGVSDHAGVFMFIQSATEADEQITARNYRNYDKDKLCEDFKYNLSHSRFEEFIEENDVNKATDCWVKCFQTAIDLNAPLQTFTKKKSKKRQPWFTEELIGMIEHKNKLLQWWYMYRKTEDRIAYRRIKNQINHLKRRLKSDHYCRQVDEFQNKPRKLWNVYRELTGNTKQKEHIEPDFLSKMVANDFNQYFSTVGSKIQEELKIHAEYPDLPEDGFELENETEDTVHKLIKRIRSDVATGNDNINATFLKDAIDTVTPSLTKLVNLSYETNTVPDAIKEASVRPIFKKEKKQKTIDLYLSYQL